MLAKIALSFDSGLGSFAAWSTAAGFGGIFVDEQLTTKL
jgi:hypothetical protein